MVPVLGTSLKNESSNGSSYVAAAAAGDGYTACCSSDGGSRTSYGYIYVGKVHYRVATEVAVVGYEAAVG